MSQSQCGRSPSQVGYRSSAWWAVTSPTTLSDASPPQTDKSFTPEPCDPVVLCGISTPFGVLFPCLGKVAHALLTRPPLKQFIASYSLSPLDLHVLGTPPAFVLSQDQTLSFNPLFLNQVSPTKFHSFGITVLFALLLFCIVFKVRRFLLTAQAAQRGSLFIIS